MIYPISHKFNANDVSNDIESYIRKNDLAHGVKLKTGSEYACKYQVSLKTVERAMSLLVQKGLVERRRGSGSFVCRKATRVEQKDRRVALFLWTRDAVELSPELDFAAYDSFTRKIIETLKLNKLHCTYFTENSTDRSNLKIFQLDLEQYDLIIAAAGILQNAEDFVRNIKVPVLLINDDKVNSGPWYQIVYDYQPGFEAAIKHFQKQGFERFFVAGYDSFVSTNRMLSIQKAAKSMKLAKENIVAHNGYNSFPSLLLCDRDCAAYYCEQRLFDHAIISCSDFLTYGILSYMDEKKLKAGQDFKLISYDNLESNVKDPALKLGISAITHPMDQAVSAIVELAEELANSKTTNFQYYKTIHVPAKELVLRNSG